MNYQNIINDIESKKLAPVYFLHGEEPFFIELLEKYFLDNVIPENDRDFNQHVLYAKDYDLETIVKLAQQFPMMGDKQLILVKEAQNYSNFEAVQKYLKQVLSSTVLVFSYKGKKAGIKVEKCIDGAKIFHSNVLYDNQIPEWITGQTEIRGLKIEPKATVLLCEFLGNDLSKIANELDKLKIVLPEGALISIDVIEKNIGISKEFNVFELIKALANKDVLKSMRIADFFAKNERKYPLVLTIGLLYGFFGKVLLTHFAPSGSPDVLAKILKVNRFFIKDYQVAAIKYNRKEVAENIHFLKEYDLKSKGINNASLNEGELLKELLFKLLR